MYFISIAAIKILKVPVQKKCSQAVLQWRYHPAVSCIRLIISLCADLEPVIPLVKNPSVNTDLIAPLAFLNAISGKSMDGKYIIFTTDVLRDCPA